MNGPTSPSAPIPTTTLPSLKEVASEGKRRVRRHRDPEEKAGHLALFAESGLSQIEYCEEMGISPATFSLWRRQARAAAGSPAETASEQTFAEVLVREPIAGGSPPLTAPPVVIHLGGDTRIEVAVGTDPLWLANVLKKLTCA